MAHECHAVVGRGGEHAGCPWVTHDDAGVDVAVGQLDLVAVDFEKAAVVYGGAADGGFGKVHGVVLGVVGVRGDVGAAGRGCGGKTPRSGGIIKTA